MRRKAGFPLSPVLAIQLSLLFLSWTCSLPHLEVLFKPKEVSVCPSSTNKPHQKKTMKIMKNNKTMTNIEKTMTYYDKPYILKVGVAGVQTHF